LGSSSVTAVAGEDDHAVVVLPSADLPNWESKSETAGHMTEPTVTHTSIVTEDQIDHLGHMNVQYYGVNARAATRATLERLGVTDPAGVEVYDLYTRHHREQLLGAELEVRSGVLGADGESIQLYHELANTATGELAATFIYRVRTDTPFDHLDTIDLPAHGAPRSIDLDAVGSHPTLAAVQGFAMRAPRTLNADDMGGGDVMSPHVVPMLIWGGTSPSGSQQSLAMTGPNGENMGWATMETRVVVGRLPAIGTRVQAFGATTAMADKTMQMSMWSFDLDTGELLVSFEVVSLLFNIDERRAMSIPDDLRAEQMENFNPALSKG